MEPPVKRGKQNDDVDEMGGLDSGQVALAVMVAKLVKKDLGEMIQDKISSGMKHVQEDIKDLTVSTMEGFKEVESKVETEKKTNKGWQLQFEGKIADMSSRLRQH